MNYHHTIENTLAFLFKGWGGAGDSLLSGDSKSLASNIENITFRYQTLGRNKP